MPLFVPRIYTASGITKENIFTEGERVLHVGSGSRKLLGSTSVDILALPGVDTVADLDHAPWPYEDDAFDVVYAHNALEHLTDQMQALGEVWRVLRPGGHFIVVVPYFRSIDAFADPTHEHFFTSQSMDCFLAEESAVAEYRYTTRRFKKRGFWYGWPQQSKNPLARLLKAFIHRHPRFYDQYLSLLLPVDILVWELEAVK